MRVILVDGRDLTLYRDLVEAQEEIEIYDACDDNIEIYLESGQKLQAFSQGESVQLREIWGGLDNGKEYLNGIIHAYLNASGVFLERATLSERVDALERIQ